MVRTVLLVALAAAASANVVVRQGATQAFDIGTKPFQLVGKGTNANCAKQISHGYVTTIAENIPKNFQNLGIEGVINFNQINATSDLNEDRQPCQKNGSMLLLSPDEIDRQTNNKARNFLGVDDKALKKIFLAGVDTGNRRCVSFNANQKSNYAFTKEISAFDERLRKDRIILAKSLKASGDKWMYQ